MITYGIDISHHNVIKWDEIPDYVMFVIIKATEGIGYRDPSFEMHIENALENFDLVGVYHFYRTLVGGFRSDPVDQALWFSEVIDPYKEDIFLRANDVERSHWIEEKENYYNPYIPTINADLEKFHQTIGNEHPMLDLIYTNLGTWGFWKLQKFMTNLDWISEHVDGLWLAYYPNVRPKKMQDLAGFGYGPDPSSKYPRPFKRHQIWQTSADFIMPGSYNKNGAEKTIDFNIVPDSYEELRKAAGFYNKKMRDPTRLSRELPGLHPI